MANADTSDALVHPGDARGAAVVVGAVIAGASGGSSSPPSRPHTSGPADEVDR